MHDVYLYTCMKFGIRLLGNHLGDSSRIVYLAKTAEDAGFDYAWFPNDVFMRNGISHATAAAAVTNRLKIGCNFNGISVGIAEAATMMCAIDDISRGRGVFSVGDHSEDLFKWIGMERKNDFVEYTRQNMKILRTLLRGEQAQMDSEYYKWNSECFLRFKPVRRDVPIYICPYGPRMFELSGEIGDGSLPMATPPESLEDVIPLIKKGAKKAGRDNNGIDIVPMIWLSVSDDVDKAEVLVKKWIAFFGYYLEDSMLKWAGVSHQDFEPLYKTLTNGQDHCYGDSDSEYEKRLTDASGMVTKKMLRLAVCGTPKECIERLARLKELGATQVSIGGPLGDPPDDAIRLIGNKIIPVLR